MPSVYLDTNVISGMAEGKFSHSVMEAIVRLTELSKSGSIDLFTSEITEEELAQIPKPYRAQHYIIYNLLKNLARPLAQPQQQIVTRGGTHAFAWAFTGSADLQQELDSLIPRRKNLVKQRARNRDIAHLARCKRAGLDFFLTEDHRSILRYRDGLQRLGITAVSSLELSEQLG